MGRSYLLQCAKCDYRAVVAGGVAEGYDLKVQTIHCRDCRTLADCVIAIRSNAAPRLWKQLDLVPEEIQPNLTQALNRLPPSPSKGRRWVTFTLVCPADSYHRVEPWTAPGRCPKCKAYLERGALPYRVWD